MPVARPPARRAVRQMAARRRHRQVAHAVSPIGQQPVAAGRQGRQGDAPCPQDSPVRRGDRLGHALTGGDVHHGAVAVLAIDRQTQRAVAQRGAEPQGAALAGAHHQRGRQRPGGLLRQAVQAVGCLCQRVAGQMHRPQQRPARVLAVTWCRPSRSHHPVAMPAEAASRPSASPGSDGRRRGAGASRSSTTARGATFSVAASVRFRRRRGRAVGQHRARAKPGRGAGSVTCSGAAPPCSRTNTRSAASVAEAGA